jgi:hypothetical protein
VAGYSPQRHDAAEPQAKEKWLTTKHTKSTKEERFFQDSMPSPIFVSFVTFVVRVSLSSSATTMNSVEKITQAAKTFKQRMGAQ